MALRGPVLSLCALAFAAAAFAEPSPARYDRVAIAPTKTSIYVGTVTMTMPPFVRHGGLYASTYTAKVFPFFFLGERGTLTISVSDAALRQLARGEPIDFDGRGTSESGAARRLTGHAQPADATSGHLTVRVSLSKRIQLIFHTTYRFLGP